MASILLINPPFNIAKENYDSSVSVGLLSIASFLVHKHKKVKLIDGARQKDYREQIEREAPHYDVVGISVMTTQIAHALAISRLVKKRNPHCRVVWGGSHPTFFIEQTIAHPDVDIVVFGEGELTLLQLLESQDLSAISGIAYKKDGVVRINPGRPLHDPAQMPLFNWELVEHSVLNKLSLIPSLTSRGCPHRCTFCINVILKTRWRARTVEQVLHDLTIIKQKAYFKGKSIRFWDENFFVNTPRVKAIVSGMIARDLSIPWETTIRVDYVREGMVDDAFMEQIRESGCYLLSFGAESGSTRILSKIQKDVTPEQILHSAKVCLRHGIIPQYSFMIGLPGESRKDMMLTLDLIDRLVALSHRVQILGPQAFRPYPGSELYQECIAAGWREPETLSQWAHLVENELSYMSVKDFPWVRNKDFVESIEAYTRFGAMSIRSAMGSTIKASRVLKLPFILLCKLRWKLKFFLFPFEYKLARKFVAK